MRLIRVIGAVNVILGVVFSIIPIQFYRMIKTVLTPSIQPPFGWGAIWTVALLLWIPTLGLIISGVALILIDEKLIKVPEYDVYTGTGKFLGSIRKVKAPEGVAESFIVDEEEGEEEILDEDVLAGDDVVLVKEDRTRRHSAVGKEVYTERGDFLGYVKDVALGPEGGLIEINVRKGEFKTTVKKSDILSIDTIILVK